MSDWSMFLFMTGGLLFYVVLISVGDWFHDRRWKQQREAAERASQHPAE